MVIVVCLIHYVYLMCDFLSNTNDDLHCFSITSIDAYSKGPWKLPQPVNILGVGKPLNDNCEPSVPPRIGAVFGSILKSLNTF